MMYLFATAVISNIFFVKLWEKIPVLERSTLKK